MFLQRDALKRLDEGFGLPIESIMGCEDFKSNFARKLSNRYVSRAPVKQDATLTVHHESQGSKNVPERIEPCPQLSKSSIKEYNIEPVKSFDKTLRRNSDMRHIEVTALNMEVDTLKWQLAQTEANRQMHIALIKQIVTFLNRVKDHIGSQAEESLIRAESLSSKLFSRSYNCNDLPRSRSVLHVSKNLEFSPNSPKRGNSRKISKSISNVNGFKDSTAIWKQSKLSLVSEAETSQKMSEEISRLINLANTVLSTKLPDLACSCNDKVNEAIAPSGLNQLDTHSNKTTDCLNVIDEDATDKYIINAICDTTDFNNLSKRKDKSYNELHGSLSSLATLKNEFDCIKLDDNVETMIENVSDPTEKCVMKERKDYNANNFIEDESGFSSMSSFQDIGIPIISIIPPSPCKEMDYIEGMPDIAEETGAWKTDAVELDHQAVKVFWV